MPTRSKSFILILVLLMIFLTACGLIPGISIPDPGEDGDVNPDLSKEAVRAHVEDGTATIHYSFKVDTPPVVKINIEPVIPLVIDEGDNPNSYVVGGIAETMATMSMQAVGGPTGSCHVECQIPVRVTAVGTLELDEVNNNCKMPIQFKLTPQEDESILTGDCPDQTLETIECVAFLALMIDPSTYTFTKEFREIDLPAELGVTMRAKILNVVMPLNTQDICDWE